MKRWTIYLNRSLPSRVAADRAEFDGHRIEVLQGPDRAVMVHDDTIVTVYFSERDQLVIPWHNVLAVTVEDDGQEDDE